MNAPRHVAYHGSVPNAVECDVPEATCLHRQV